MSGFKLLAKKRVNNLPKTFGVYCFKTGKTILYIGKASNIRERVKNHFQQPAYRDNLFIDRAQKIGYFITDSEVEALVLEAELIKKYQPKYNVIWKDDKNYFYVGVTKDDFPRLFITHQPKRAPNERSVKYIGPFVEGSALKKTLQILRKIFPYYAVKKHPKGLCSWCHLGLCPGPGPDKNIYQKNIKRLTAVLMGKKKSLLKELKKEMDRASSSKNFERAAVARDQAWALGKILSNAKIFNAAGASGDRYSFFPRHKNAEWTKTEKNLKNILGLKNRVKRIEAYDISNIQGQQATGSMVVFANGEADKSQYRKFRIKILNKPNDTAMIREVLERRFRHTEWPYPDLILIDGGKPQLNIAVKTKAEKRQASHITITALAKKKNELFVEGTKTPILLENSPRDIFNLFLRLRDESHRFAQKYHHRLRTIDLLSKP